MTEGRWAEVPCYWHSFIQMGGLASRAMWVREYSFSSLIKLWDQALRRSQWLRVLFIAFAWICKGQMGLWAPILKSKKIMPGHSVQKSAATFPFLPTPHQSFSASQLASQSRLDCPSHILPSPKAQYSNASTRSLVLRKGAQLEALPLYFEKEPNPAPLQILMGKVWRSRSLWDRTVRGQWAAAPVLAQWLKAESSRGLFTNPIAGLYLCVIFCTHKGHQHKAQVPWHYEDFLTPPNSIVIIVVILKKKACTRMDFVKWLCR